MSIPALKVNGNSSIYTCTNRNLNSTAQKVSRTLIAITLTFLFMVSGSFLLSTYAAGNTPAAEGTYQFIFSKPSKVDAVTLNTSQLIAIENLRKENEVVYAASASNDYLKVKILPRSVVNAGNYTPVPRNIFKSEMSEQEIKSMRYVQLP